MNTAVHPVSGPGPQDFRAMNRALRWSLIVHVGVVAALFLVPREWLSDKQPPVMTITLGGTPGPMSTGTTSIGGRTVEQVTPPPKRPEPIRPTPKPQAEPAPVVTPPVKPPPPAAAPKPVVTPKLAPPPPPRPVATGRQVVQGNSRVETGARGLGAGLTQGGGISGGVTDLQDFCCPEYLQLLMQQVDSRWIKTQPAQGTTTIQFTILRDGTITDIQVEKPSGSGILDRASRSAVTGFKMTPLPAAYTADKLTVHLHFPYEGR